MVAETGNPVEWAVEVLPEAETPEEIRQIMRSSVRVTVQAQGATVVELVACATTLARTR